MAAHEWRFFPEMGAVTRHCGEKATAAVTPFIPSPVDPAMPGADHAGGEECGCLFYPLWKFAGGKKLKIGRGAHPGGMGGAG
jgi:hypothetical protein